MMCNKDKYEARAYEVGTLIKLVAGLNVDGVYKVATNIQKYYGRDDIDGLSNDVIYDAYCETCMNQCKRIHTLLRG